MTVDEARTLVALYGSVGRAAEELLTPEEREAYARWYPKYSTYTRWQEVRISQLAKIITARGHEE